MKKVIALLLFSSCLIMAGCESQRPSNAAPTGSTGFEEPAPTGSEVVLVDPAEEKHNMKYISDALGVSADERNIKFIVAELREVSAGYIKQATYEDKDNGVLYITAEDGTHYEVLLSAGGNIDAIHNLDTDEWPMMSIR